MTRTISWGRRCVVGLLALCLLVLGGTVVLAVTARVTSHDTLVIRGGSMQPAIPLGAVVVTEPVDPKAIRVGDVISIHAVNGVTFTHRVIGISEAKGEPAFQTKGDANQTKDPSLVPAAAVLGRVVLTIPLLGYLLALLSTVSGVTSVACILASLLASYWLFDDIDHEQREERRKLERAMALARDRLAVAAPQPGMAGR